jgi:Amt family ammonium transporter
MNDVAQALCVALILLVPLAAAGLALMNSGLSRSRSAAHAMLAPLCVMAVAMLAYFVCGWSWQSFAGRSSHVFTFAGRQLDWIADEPFFLRGLTLDGSPASLAAWLQMFSVALAAIIPLGAGSERWRLGASCASAALLAGWTYPLFAHWVWSGGWLAQIGMVDSGGASTIHAVGGLTALAIVRILGPRQGKYDSEGVPAAFPGHNAVLVLFGCFLTWLGFIGLNGAGSMLFGGFSASSIVLVAINTTLSAAAGLLAVAALTRARFGQPDASLCANGWTGGLVAISAGCTWIAPLAAIVIGAIAGVLVALSIEWLDVRRRVDDPAGAISVHAVSGLWGLLALALFGPAQWFAQIAGVAALLVIVLPMTYGLNRLLNRFYPQRVAREGEPHGLDLHELGAGAYPDFVTRRDDFRPR